MWRFLFLLAALGVLVSAKRPRICAQDAQKVLERTADVVVGKKSGLSYPFEVKWKNSPQQQIQLVPGDVVEVSIEGPDERLIERWTRPWERKTEKKDGKDTIITTEKLNPHDDVCGNLGDSIRIEI